MSTFLVSLGVVAATIAAVVHVVLNSPDQPATLRRQPSRAERRSQRQDERAAQAKAKAAAAAAAPAPAPRPPVAIPGMPALALPDSDIMRLRVLPATQTTVWVRVRSTLALVILVAVLGALLALAIGAVVLGGALLIRSATG